MAGTDEEALSRSIPIAIYLYIILFLYYLRPFSFSPKKKGQKERRRSARGRFFPVKHGESASAREAGDLLFRRFFGTIGDARFLRPRLLVSGGFFAANKPPISPPDGKESDP